MNTERDRFLTEAMGECWHEFDAEPSLFGEWEDESNYCNKCSYRKGLNDVLPVNNFSSWEDFGKLWDWASSQVGLLRMITNELDENDSYRWTHWVHPDRFADAVYAYLKEKK